MDLALFEAAFAIHLAPNRDGTLIISGIGTAVVIFPIVRRQNESLHSRPRPAA